MFVCFSELVSAQPKPPEPFFQWRKVFFGGNIGGVSFSSQGTYIDLSPHIGYRFTEKFSAGTGFIYQYISQSGLEAHNYGGKLFARYLIWRGVFAHTEYQQLNMKYFYVDKNQNIYSKRRWVGSMFLGGGLQQNLGGNSTIYVMGLYDVLYKSEYSPHSNPFYFTMGIGLGF